MHPSYNILHVEYASETRGPRARRTAPVYFGVTPKIQLKDGYSLSVPDQRPKHVCHLIETPDRLYVPIPPALFRLPFNAQSPRISLIPILEDADMGKLSPRAILLHSYAFVWPGPGSHSGTPRMKISANRKGWLVVCFRTYK